MQGTLMNQSLFVDLWHIFLPFLEEYIFYERFCFSHISKFSILHEAKQILSPSIILCGVPKAAMLMVPVQRENLINLTVALEP